MTHGNQYHKHNGMFALSGMYDTSNHHDRKLILPINTNSVKPLNIMMISSVLVYNSEKRIRNKYRLLVSIIKTLYLCNHNLSRLKKRIPYITLCII